MRLRTKSIVSFALLLAQGPQPSTGLDALKGLPDRKLLFQTVQGLFALADILLVPSAIALYLALKEVRKTHMLIATGFVGLAIALDLVITVVYYSLVRLSAEFAATTSEAQKAGYVAAANLVLGQSAAGFLMAVLLFVAWIFVSSYVMFKGGFNKGTAYVGTVTGILGVIGSVQFLGIQPAGIIFLISIILFGIWLLAVGSKLYRLG